MKCYYYTCACCGYVVLNPKYAINDIEYYCSKKCIDEQYTDEEQKQLQNDDVLKVNEDV